MFERISEWCVVNLLAAIFFLFLYTLGNDVAEHAVDMYAINCLLLFAYSWFVYAITKSIIHSYKLDKKSYDFYRSYNK